MLDVAGRPLIWHIFDRLKRVPNLQGIILGTTTKSEDDRLVSFAEAEGIAIHREKNSNDIAARLAGAVKQVGATGILKVNGDCPLVDPEILTRLTQRFMEKPEVDYVSNKVVWTYPKGLSAELISARAIDWCNRHLLAPKDRELVADWIRDHSEKFEVVSIQGERNLSDFNWSVDTQNDYTFVCKIFEHLYQPGDIFGLDDVLGFLESTAVGES